MVLGARDIAVGALRHLAGHGRPVTGAGRIRSRRSRDVAYFRLHGSPRMYWSRYDEGAITTLAATIGSMSPAEHVWCVFDNTASGAAIENACELRERLTVGRSTIPFGHRSSGLPEVTSRR